MQESQFINRLKNGDHDAFRLLIDQYQVPILKLCKGFLHNDEDAKDVTQDTFIEVIQSINRFRGNAKLSTWLYRIAVNKSLNLIRKRKHVIPFRAFDQLFHSEKNPNKSLVNTNSDTLVDPLEKDDRKKYIKKALDTLPENQRIAFLLNKYINLSYKEIAETMEVSVSAVESLIHRAKTNLQQKLYKLYRKNLL